jgi:hypothetical protein
MTAAIQQVIEKWHRRIDRGFDPEETPETTSFWNGAKRVVDELAALLAGQGAAPHRCSGCGHQWDGPLKGAELCGDCWRIAQPSVHDPVLPASREIPPTPRCCTRCGQWFCDRPAVEDPAICARCWLIRESRVGDEQTNDDDAR